LPLSALLLRLRAATDGGASGSSSPPHPGHNGASDALTRGRSYSPSCIFMRLHKMSRPPARRVRPRRSHPRATEGRFMQDLASELPRISLPRTPVNNTATSRNGVLGACPTPTMLRPSTRGCAVVALSVGPPCRGSRRCGSPLTAARCCFPRGAASHPERRTSAAASTTTRALRARRPRGHRRCPRAGRSLPAASRLRRRSGCRTSRRRTCRPPVTTRILWASRRQPHLLRAVPREERDRSTAGTAAVPAVAVDDGRATRGPHRNGPATATAAGHSSRVRGGR